MAENYKPLIVVVDSAGGEPYDRMTRRVADALSRSGVSPERIGLWPNTVSTDLWSMPVEDLRAIVETLLGQVPSEEVNQS